MTEDHLITLFGDVTVVRAVTWLIALTVLAAVLIKVWPVLTRFVSSINLLFQLADKLDCIDSKLERVRAQVENSHDTNLRDELDADRQAASHRHTEVMDRISGVQKDVGRLDTREIELGREIRDARQDIGSVRADLTAHVEWSRGQEDRIDGLEDTLNPPKEKPSCPLPPPS